MRLRNAAGTAVEVSDDLAARLVRRGWRPDAPDPPPAEPSADGLPDDKDQLVALAEAEGVEIDRRWGAARLTDAIRTARKGDG